MKERMRYLGALGLLAECSIYVPEDIREQIESAFQDACTGDSGLTWRRALDRLEITAVQFPETPTGDCGGRCAGKGRGMKRFRIFTNDRGGSLYSALCDVWAKSQKSALRQAQAKAFNHERAWVIQWPVVLAADKRWLRKHVGDDL